QTVLKERGATGRGRVAGLLPRLDAARVDVGLHLPESGDQLGIPAGEADTPTGHVEGLGERVELDRPLAPTRDLEDARRPLAEVDLGVGGIVAEDHLVAGRPAGRPPPQSAWRARRRRG